MVVIGPDQDAEVAALLVLPDVDPADVVAPAPMWLLTREATPAGGIAPDPHAARTWGLGRTLALETPARFGGLVDLPE